jgi:hypothetical protein
MTDRVLTIEQAGQLAEIIRGVERGLKLRYYPRGTEDADHPLKVSMRAFTRQGGGGFFPMNGDIRDAYVWCSSFMEHWLLVSDLMKAMSNVSTLADGENAPMAIIDTE